MDWIGTLGQALIAKFDVVTLVLLLLVAGCGYFHVIWRREDRQEREKLMGVIEKNNEALNGIKNVISAALGKAL